MSPKSKRISTGMALLLVFAISHVYVGAGFAARSSNSMPPATVQGVSAVLTTDQNKPITVNGLAAITGATVVSGSLVETPKLVSATINIPGHFTLDVAADTRALLAFDPNGNPRVNLREGCVTLHTKQGTTGEIETTRGLAGKTDPTKDDVIRVCFARGAAVPIVDGGAGPAAVGGGLSGGAIAAIVLGGAGAAIGIGLALRGRNPSPSGP